MSVCGYAEMKQVYAATESKTPGSNRISETLKATPPKLPGEKLPETQETQETHKTKSKVCCSLALTAKIPSNSEICESILKRSLRRHD